jgi:uncharacterized protein (TIGR00251 family)
MKTSLHLESHPEGVILTVRAQAKARRNAVVGIHAGMLRVAVTEAPEKGKANKAIAAVLSKALGLSKSAIQLRSGETSPQKRFLIVGAEADTIGNQIAQLLV